MSIKPLHDAFISAMKRELPGWKFIATHRHFRKPFSGGNWLVHITFINHPQDCDAVIDVAIEFLDGKRRICIVGASLGNIEGTGQVRYRVGSEDEAKTAAVRAATHLQRVGMPFLEHYSIPGNVLSSLKKGGAEASLISPLEQMRAQQIAALEDFMNAV